MSKQLISIVIPAYNEADCLDELLAQLRRVISSLSSYDFEIIVVDNGSSDDTWLVLNRLRETEPRLKLVQLSRNFRTDGGLSAGLSVARGDAAVLMAADLQDPPEMINDFLKHWELGYENIYMVVAQRRHSSLIRRINSRMFYWLIGMLSDVDLPPNVSDFRLVDRKVYLAVLKMEERGRYLRGLFAWSGFKSMGISRERPARYSGESKASTSLVLDLALKGVLSFSRKPLHAIALLSLTLSALTLALILGFCVSWIVGGVPFDGFGTIVASSLLAFSLLSLMLGIIAEYVGLIYEEVKGRPNWIISKQIGFNHDE